MIDIKSNLRFKNKDQIKIKEASVLLIKKNKGD
jgi:hypothetical protein